MEKQQLKRGLLPRHVQLLALAGMIGTGIFKGSADTLHIAGPSVIFAYLLGGILLLIVMAALAELAVVYPNLNIQHLMYKAFGFQISFVVGWLYWINWMIVTIVEILAAGSFLKYWFSTVPLWVLSLICAIFIVALNTFQVKYYGELEFWFAGIKITALIAFIVLGALVLFGFTSSSPEQPFSNYVSHGGFFPHGIRGILTGFLIVMFSYGGSELIGVAITETKDAEKVLPRVIKGVVWRVVIFYVLPILVICGLIPWNQVSGTDSPFVQVFSAIGLPGAAHIMNFVLLTAVLSAANSGMYATSRTLHAMSQNGEAHKIFSTLSKTGVPVFGILLNGVCLAAGVLLAYMTPDKVIGYLMSIPGFTVILLWISICLAQLKLRPKYENMPFFRVRAFPYTTISAIVCLSVIFISFLFNKDNVIGSSVCIIILVTLTIMSIAQGKKSKHKSNLKETLHG